MGANDEDVPVRRVDISHRFNLVTGETWRSLACGHKQREPNGAAPAKTQQAQCRECPTPKQRHGAVKALAGRVRR